MTRRFRTIRVRLTLWYMLLLGLILVFFSGVLYLMLARALYQQVDGGLRLAAEQTVAAINQENGQLNLQQSGGEGEGPTLSERDLLVRIVDLGGRIVDSSGPFRDLPVPAIALTTARQGQSRFVTVSTRSDPTPVRLYSVPYQENGQVSAVIQVGQSLESVQDTLRQLLLILAFAVPVTLVVASLGGLFLADRALSPIDRITRTAQRISAEDLSQRLGLTLPDDEVGRLARTFDAMLARLDDAFRRQRQFTADASHELRTPLTVMKGDIGVALNRPRPTGEYRRVLAELEEEVDRLTRLVEDLLLLARADTGRPLLQPESLDLASLLRAVADQVRPLAEARELTLHLQVPDSLPLNGDPDKLIRLFLNLLDNAVKYTPAGGQVTLRATADGRRPPAVSVQVTDTGPGIPRDQLEHIFERFYRADESRSRAAGGSGLGLAIARWIAEAHGGRIEVHSEPGHGSTFSVWLPG
jgi:two-component system OmpR family sensor kinase